MSNQTIQNSATPQLHRQGSSSSSQFSKGERVKSVSGPQGLVSSKFVRTRPQRTVGNPQANAGNPPSQLEQLMVQPQQPIAVQERPQLYSGKPPTWVAGGGSQTPYQHQPEGIQGEGRYLAPFAATSPEHQQYESILAGQGPQGRVVLAPMSGPQGPVPQAGADVEAGLLVRDSMQAQTTVGLPQVHLGSHLGGGSSIGLNTTGSSSSQYPPIQQRAFKPTIKSAKQMMRAQNQRKSTQSHKQKRKFTSGSYDNKLDGKADHNSCRDGDRRNPYSFKPKINDMSKSPFLVPVVSALTVQSQGRLSASNQKVYPKFIDKVFMQQILEKRQAAEEVLPSLDAHIGGHGLLAPAQRPTRKHLSSIKQKPDRSSKAPDQAQRFPSNPMNNDPFSLGVQGSSLGRQDANDAQRGATFGMSNSAAIQMYSPPQTHRKRFFMNAGYPDLRAALLRRGWVESLNKHDDTVDLKFTLSSSDIEYSRLSERTLINHCRAEGSMTCKTSLIETLSDAQQFWASWLADKETGYADISIAGFERSGIDAFFPKSFIISNIQDQAQCFEEMVFVTCESYLKLYLQAFEKDPQFKNERQDFLKEKLMVCASLVLRRISTRKADDILECKGDKPYTGMHLTLQEHAFILRGGGYPDSYLKFIHREEWFVQIQRQLQHHFSKNKSLKTKEERARSLWTNSYNFVKLVVQELRFHFPQVDLNGTGNQWIVKPGGLSRGRKIRIFDNYAEICRHAELPFMQNPNGVQAFDLNGSTRAEQPQWTQKSWVAQKYIENPLLVMNRKFDIRVWVVVASWNPLRVYYFKSCYLRFSGMDYDPKKTDNLFSHLTNNSIIAKQIRMADDRNFDKIPENMWHLEQLKNFLNERQRKLVKTEKKGAEEAQQPPNQNGASDEDTTAQTASSNTPEIPRLQHGAGLGAGGASTQPGGQGSTAPQPDPKNDNGTNEVAQKAEQTSPDSPNNIQGGKSENKDGRQALEDVWDTQLLAQLKDIMRITFLSGWGYVEWREGSIGIYGIDVMIDTNLRMWLIEVNKSPCFAYSTQVTRALIPRFMEDLAKVVVDRADKVSGAGGGSVGDADPLETGDLELILECPFVREPTQEIRSGEEYAVDGRRIPNPNPKIEKGKYHLNRR